MADCEARLQVVDGSGSDARACPPGAAPERVAIVLPECVQPGVSQVEVDVGEGERLRLLVPEEAKPGDKLLLAPDCDGDWGCSIMRPCNGAAVPPRRQLAAFVPAGAVPGETQLALDAEGERLTLTVPEGAVEGDRLVLTQGSDEQWHCHLERARPGLQGRGHKPTARPGEIFCVVPPDITPGKTCLRLAATPEGEGCDPPPITVPAEARPGDELGISQREDGVWTVRILRDRATAPLGLRAKPCSLGITLSRIRRGPQETFANQVAAASAEGAWVNPKLARGAVPPMNICGMLAGEPLAEGEELARMPAELHLSITRLQRAMPQLFEALDRASHALQGRVAEAGHAAALAMLLAAAEERATAGAATVDGTEGKACESRDSGMPKIWDAYAEYILSGTFDGHPYWQCLDNAAGVEKLMAPSREQDYMAMMAGDIVAMHEALVDHVGSDILGPRFHLGFFFQARLHILTHVFQLNGDSALVPINDCFNHGANPGATWRWDAEREHMVLVATRAHDQGEEVFISYGRRSNVLLFRTYGFTLPSEVEPTWTYIAQGGGRLAHIYAKYLPEKAWRLAVHMESHIVQDSLVEALNHCTKHGRDPEAFLRELCICSMEPYECDKALLPALEALRRVRRTAPASSAWWTELPSAAQGEAQLYVAAARGYCGGPATSGEEDVEKGQDKDAELAGWAEHAIRVKMSEYLCLTAHLEILDVAAGRLSEEQCLEGAKSARDVLLAGLQILRRGGNFACDMDVAVSGLRGLT